MAVLPYSSPPAENVANAGLCATAGMWWQQVTNSALGQGPGNRVKQLISAHTYGSCAFGAADGASYCGTRATTVAIAQPSGTGIGSITGSFPVIVNGTTIWMETGAACTVPTVVRAILSNIGVTYT